jgi:hypothetical protein
MSAGRLTPPEFLDSRLETGRIRKKPETRGGEARPYCMTIDEYSALPTGR